MLIAFYRGTTFKGDCNDDLVSLDVCFNTGDEYLESLNLNPSRFSEVVTQPVTPVCILLALSVFALRGVAYN